MQSVLYAWTNDAADSHLRWWCRHYCCQHQRAVPTRTFVTHSTCTLTDTLLCDDAGQTTVACTLWPNKETIAPLPTVCVWLIQLHIVINIENLHSQCNGIVTKWYLNPWRLSACTRVSCRNKTSWTLFRCFLQRSTSVYAMLKLGSLLGIMLFASNLCLIYNAPIPLYTGLSDTNALHLRHQGFVS